jgi:hypothetical protein
MVSIVLGVNSVLGVAVRSNNTVASSKLIEILDRYSVSISGPGCSAGDAIHYYTIENVNADISDGLIGELTTVAGVEAAFLKPSDELP